MSRLLYLLSNYVAQYFFHIWAATVVAFGLLAWSFCKNGAFELRKKTDSETGRHVSPTVRVVLLGFFLVFVAAYCYLIVDKEDFAFHDNHLFTHSSLQGKDQPAPIWKSEGRFFPLGFQEFNLLGHVTRSPLGYHAFAIVQLVVVLLALLRLLENLPLWFRLLIPVLVMASPSVVISFFGLIFPERNVVFWLAVLLLSHRRFQETKSALHACVAVIAAQFALYYKEPVFALIGGFAAARLLLSMTLEKDFGRRVGFRGFIRTHCLDVLLLILSVLFVVVYAVVVLPHTDFGYASGNSEGFLVVLGSYFKYDPWLAVLFLTLAARLAYFAHTKKRPDSFWDPLAVGAGLYALIYLMLGMFDEYYMAPVDFVAAAYLGRAAWPLLQSRRLVGYAAVAILVGVVAIQSIPHSWFHIVDRKGWIDSNVRLAAFVKERTTGPAARPVTLFFPYTDPYPLMLTSTFLEYKGLRPAECELCDANGEVDFLIKSPHPFRGRRCMESRPSGSCLHAESPSPGDLIVIHPDDIVAAEELVTLAGEATLVLHHHPRGQHGASVMMKWLGIHPSTDGWLDLYVFQQP